MKYRKLGTTGLALRDFANREEVVLATKVFMAVNRDGPNSRRLSRKAIMSSIDASLRRLQTDYVTCSKALYTADAHGWTRFVTMQNHYNLLNREEEREMLPLCADQGIGVSPWSPLARGKLTRDWDERAPRGRPLPVGR